MAGEITADATYSIGSLAKIANTKVQTIRYYEQIGLIPAVHRTQGNQRFYGASHRDRRWYRPGWECPFSWPDRPPSWTRAWPT